MSSSLRWLRPFLPCAAALLAAAAWGDYYSTSLDRVTGVGSVYRCDDAGNILQVSTAPGFIEPISLTFDSLNRLLVADYLTGKIQAFLADGSYIGEFATLPETLGSILMHPDGTVLAADYLGGPVRRLDVDGSVLPNFIDDTGLGRHGQMAFDTVGNFYVCSFNDDKILQYDIFGNYLGVFSDTALSGIAHIVGIAPDPSGQMYVSEFVSHDIKLLAADGSLISTLTTTADEPQYLTLEGDSLLVPTTFLGEVRRILTDGTDLGVFTTAPRTYQTVKGPAYFFTDNVSIRRGRQQGGNLASLEHIDNDHFRVCKFIVLNAVEPPIQMQISAQTDSLDVSSQYSVFVTSKMNAPGAFQQRVSLVDENGTVSATETRADTVGLTQKTVHLAPADPSAFVRSDGRVTIDVTVRQTGPTTVSLWCFDIDQVLWNVNP